MNIMYRGNIETTEAIKDYVEDKVGRIADYFEDGMILDTTVTLKTQSHNKKIKVVVKTNSFTIRAEVVDEDLYASIDLVVEKLERQIRKYKTRVNRKMRHKGHTPAFLHTVEEDSAEEELVVVKRKEREATVLPLEDAIEQAKALGHYFFIYREIENFDIRVLILKDTEYIEEAIEFKEMLLEEAIVEMEMNDFIFFPFVENNRKFIVYKRHKDNFGVIEVM